ncbi:helix-turn-helix domain-containing protein [Enterobacteriaceae bacterium LUAb1]
MEELSAVTQKILNLLTKKGIEKRRHASTIAEILGIKYNSAKQKLDEKRKFSFSEIRKIYNNFNESDDDAKEFNCVLIMNDLHIRCNIEAEHTPSEETDDNNKYAIKRNELFIIATGNAHHYEQEKYKVKKIDFLPAPKLAILDNESDILLLLKMLCSRYGIETHIFQRKDEITEAIKTNRYDAFIVDWLLDFGETAEEVIKAIRHNHELSPVIILSGQVNQYEHNIGKTIINYDVVLIEKPARPMIISSILLNSLFFNE